MPGFGADFRGNQHYFSVPVMFPVAPRRAEDFCPEALPLCHRGFCAINPIKLVALTTALPFHPQNVARPT